MTTQDARVGSWSLRGTQGTDVPVGVTWIDAAGDPDPLGADEVVVYVGGSEDDPMDWSEATGYEGANVGNRSAHVVTIPHGVSVPLRIVRAGVLRTIGALFPSEMGTVSPVAEVTVQAGSGELVIQTLGTSGGGSTTLAGLSDVDVDGATDGQALTFDADAGEWVPATISGTGAVDSVNGQTGVVVLDQDDVGDGTTYKRFSATEQSKLSGVAEGAEVNVQSDWNASSGDAFIQNKPTLGTAAALDVGTGAGTVAAGDDSRLSDARTPTAHAASHQDGGSDELALDGSQITTGTVADARIASTIARDTEVTDAIAAASTEIDDLPAAGALDLSELVPADQDGTTVKIPLSDVIEAIDRLEIASGWMTFDADPTWGGVRVNIFQSGDTQPRVQIASHALATGISFGPGGASAVDAGIIRGAGGQVAFTGGISIGGFSILGTERTDPAAPPANNGLLYFKDNGAGKTQLVCRFATGAVQVIATEP